ncbi:glycosyltransferase [Methylacidimicrobium tartarophylax]|uniref:GalNAc(5)-diNAcBac-PP-undecaprenol beta-1,3-glucosyltransferase n=1 Tax=Methylacidimicrobium tartarophylax TaxID=1041768 RepID=A0A5E6MAK5_9BACT|nr:glycosyltransferase [Methylacidimicrobium tartarophylax]VVM06582.1 GalNAc(5)-diNAcBac-PP-undecaprenol beta-1,3-glucosyltransferase [Methylacidimicrobium tartarophylax]
MKQENPRWGRLPVPEGSRRAERLPVCFVTTEFLGWPGAGGVATAYGNLAEVLVAAGFPVTVLCALPPWAVRADEEAFQERWRARNVELHFLDRDPPAAVSGRPATVRAYQVYEWLRAREKSFSIVHVADVLGLGYMALLAKRQGLAFSQVTFVVGVHGGELMKEGSRELPPDLGPMEFEFLEQESVRLADFAVSPSRFYLELMERRRWELPQRCCVEPNLVPPSFLRRSRKTPVPSTLQELVFFGRLTSRKGVPLFCDALDRLAAAGENRLERITFLGHIGEVDGRNAREYLEDRAHRWRWPWQILSDRSRDQALAYFQEGTGKLAVVASRAENYPYTLLECCLLGIPVLAARSWGIPEIVTPSDHSRVLFLPDPAELAKKLSQALREGVRPASLAHDPEEVRERWIRFHEYLAEERRAPRIVVDGQLPFVSVCLTHHDRPGYLRQALDSLKRQDYPASRFEVILVDDGSQTPEARKTLSSLEEELAERNWTLLRHANRGPGAARNCAAARAKGDYLLFMDDDNIARPEEVSTFVQAATRSHADLYTCLKPYFSGDEEPSGKDPEEIWIPTGGSALLGIFANCFGDTNTLVRKSTFDALRGFAEEREIVADWEFYLRAVLRGFRLEVIPAPLFWCRRGHISLSASSAGNSTFRQFREYPVLASAREALTPSLQELPLFAKGIWERLQKVWAEYCQLQSDHSQLQSDHSRLQSDHSQLQSELSRPLHLVERGVRIGRQRVVTDIRRGLRSVERSLRPLWRRFRRER